MFFLVTSNDDLSISCNDVGDDGAITMIQLRFHIISKKVPTHIDRMTQAIRFELLGRDDFLFGRCCLTCCRVPQGQEGLLISNDPRC